MDSLKTTRALDAFTAPELSRILERSELFKGSGEGTLSDFAEVLDTLVVPGGEVVLRRGTPNDAAYLVVHGRLRVSTREAEDRERVLVDITSGEGVGYVHLLSENEPSPIEVRSLRDTTLLRLKRSAFQQLAPRHPEVLANIGRRFVDILKQTALGQYAPSPRLNIAILFRDTELRDVAHALIAALGSTDDVLHVTAGRLDKALGDGASQTAESDPRNRDVVAWLHEQEHRYSVVVYECEPGSTLWTGRCLRQADRLLTIAAGNAVPSRVSLKPLLAEWGRGRPPVETDLLLVHAGNLDLPSGTRRFRGSREFSRIHHLRRDRREDYHHVARRLQNRGIGVVLGGGGARGIAHVGVLKALEEANIPVDLIGGTSIGAIMGAGYARGWKADDILERVRDIFRSRRALLDLTYPYISVLAGAKLDKILLSFFEDIDIDDLWLDFFCISTNISQSRMEIHDTGSLWMGVRASCALPGIFPPVQEDEKLLIDGGIVNNLPLDVMARRTGGALVGVDITKGAIQVGDAFPTAMSGWRILGDRLNPLAKTPHIPNIFTVLLGATEISRNERLQAVLAMGKADLLLEPPAEAFKILEFHAFEKLYEIGYQHAKERLAAWSLPESIAG